MTTGSMNITTAWGAIRVDTNKLVADRQIVVREAAAMGRSFAAATAGVREFGAAIAGAAKQGATALGAISAASIPAAQRVRGLQVQFKLLAGSEAEAARQMAQLRDLADRTGTPFLELAESAASLLPAMRGTNAELASVLSVAQRLKVIDPTARAYDISVAIREFLSGEYLSLARRFELSRTQLQQITEAANGNVAAAVEGLSRYLDSMGVTQDALEELGRSGVNTFAVVRSELTEALATAGMPFLENFVLPTVQGFSHMVRTVRELNPELLQMAGTVAGIVGVPALAGRLGQIAGIPGLGRAGVYGLAATAGAVAGTAGAQFLSSRGVGDPRLADLELGEAMKLAFIGFVGAIGQAREAITEFGFVVRAAGLSIQHTWTRVTESIGHFITNLAIVLSRFGADTGDLAMSGVEMVTGASERRQELEAAAAGLAKEHNVAISAAREWTAELAIMAARMVGGEEVFEQFTGVTLKSAEAIADAADQMQASVSQMEFTSDQIEAWGEFQDELAKMRRDADERIVEETENYERSRTEAIRRAQEQRAELAEDWARQEQEHYATLAEIREDNQKALLALEEDYNDRRIRAERDHKRSLLEAAASLDAEAVWAEQRRYADQQETLKEGYDEQRERLQEQLAERLAAENEAFAKERRMYDDRLADIDRNLQRQLQEYARQHQERIAQIRTHLQQEIAERERAFMLEFNQLATHESQKLAIQRQGQAQMEAELRQWWNRMQQTLGNYAAITQAAPTTSAFGARTSTSYPNTVSGLPQSQRLGGFQVPEFQPSNYRTVGTTTITDTRWWDAVRSGYSGGYQVPAFQHGGRVLRTGLAYLHADEEVLRPDVARALRTAMGGQIDQNALAGGRSLVWNGDVNITEPGASPDQIRRVLLDALMEVVG